ncbi:MAG: hypothetical protein GXO28_07720 [Methanopyri archaeon]|nr:hypothetical protein [Methanopyri archaeon]
MRLTLFLLPLYVKSRDANTLGKMFRKLDYRNTRFLILDRAFSFVRSIHESLRDSWLVKGIGDLERLAGKGGGVAVAEIMAGLVGADVQGLDAIIVCRTYLSNYAAQRSIIVPLMLKRVRLETKNVDDPLDALRLEAFESVLYDLTTVAGRAIRTEHGEPPFTTLLGAGTVVEVARRYPEEALDIYHEFLENTGLDVEVRVRDPETGLELTLEELPGSDVQVKNLEDVNGEALIDWINENATAP